jgi:hypothetical protein
MGNGNYIYVYVRNIYNRKYIYIYIYKSTGSRHMPHRNDCVQPWQSHVGSFDNSCIYFNVRMSALSWFGINERIIKYEMNEIGTKCQPSAETGHLKLHIRANIRSSKICVSSFVLSCRESVRRPLLDATCGAASLRWLSVTSGGPAFLLFLHVNYI